MSSAMSTALGYFFMSPYIVPIKSTLGWGAEAGPKTGSGITEQIKSPEPPGRSTMYPLLFGDRNVSMGHRNLIDWVNKEFLRENQGFPDGHVISVACNLWSQMGNVSYQTHIFRSERGTVAKATLPSIFGCWFLSLHVFRFYPFASLPPGMHSH